MIEYSVGSDMDGADTCMAFQWHFWAAVEQFIRYAAIDGNATLAHYVVLLGLVQVGVSPWWASVMDNVIGATLNYFISRQVILNSTRGHIDAMVCFGLVAFLALGCNATIMAVGLGIGSHHLVVQTFASSITAIFNFSIHRCQTFHDADAVAASTESQPIIVPARPTHNGP